MCCFFNVFIFQNQLESVVAPSVLAMNLFNMIYFSMESYFILRKKNKNSVMVFYSIRFNSLVNTLDNI